MIPAALLAVTLGLDLSSPGPTPSQDVVTHVQDPAIIEASNLVISDGLFVTTNDSGDTGRVFAIDQSGATVGVTDWSDDAVDVEGLAPGDDDDVWVGDIGDNDASRPSVYVVRVPVGRGDRTVRPTHYRFTYPDHPVNAETLMRNPRTGQLFVASKLTTGGMLYAAPKDLRVSGTNALKPVAPVLPIATDGAFFPDGRHLVIRSYTEAVVYDWPSMRSIGSFTLPHERQGEGLGIDEDGTVYLSSEGPDQPILQVHLPHAIAEQVEPPASSSSGTAAWMRYGVPAVAAVLLIGLVAGAVLRRRRGTTSGPR